MRHWSCTLQAVASGDSPVPPCQPSAVEHNRHSGAGTTDRFVRAERHLCALGRPPRRITKAHLGKQVRSRRRSGTRRQWTATRDQSPGARCARRRSRSRGGYHRGGDAVERPREHEQPGDRVARAHGRYPDRANPTERSAAASRSDEDATRLGKAAPPHGAAPGARFANEQPVVSLDDK